MDLVADQLIDLPGQLWPQAYLECNFAQRPVSCLRKADAVGRSNLSTAAEADGHFARFNDDRYLAASLGVF